MAKNCQRKSDFSDPEVQGALNRRMVAQWIVFTAVAAVLAVALTWMGDPFAPFSQTLAEAWWTYAPLLLVLVCLLPVFVMDTMKLTNRFTGPMSRLRRVARQLAQGEQAQKLDFRGGDFWRGLAADMNCVIERIELAEESKSEEPEAAQS